MHTCIQTNIPYIPCMHACMHACIHTYIHTYVHTHTHTYLNSHMLACMHVQARYIVTSTHERTSMHTLKRTGLHAGKYGNGTVPCSNCPVNTNSAPRSAWCGCDHGYAGVNGKCIACVPGKYTDRNGSEACVNCPGGKYSTASAATNCSECGVGTYSFSNSTGCLVCPANTHSNASSSLWDCRCNLGYTGRDGEMCTACEPGSCCAVHCCIFCQVACTMVPNRFLVRTDPLSF